MNKLFEKSNYTKRRQNDVIIYEDISQICENKKTSFSTPPNL